jgi:hypothetical protein
VPVIVHDEGITFSSKFEFELLLWVEHPNLTATEIEAEMALTGDISCPEPDVPQDSHRLWLRHVEPADDLPSTLSRVTDRLAAVVPFLDRVRTGGGRYGCRVICKVDFNAQPILDAALLRQMASVGIDLDIHALDVETPETAAGMRRFIAIMNDPPWERRPLTEPAKGPEADPDEVS